MIRGQAREFLARSAAHAHRADEQGDAVERAITALDELASNALRHGRPPAWVELFDDEQSWLILAVDAATTKIPIPAIDRPGEQGGFGLYLVAEFSLACGIHVSDDRKQVWAQLPKAA